MPGLLFTRRAGVDIVHVPYKGGAPALQGVVAGETQMSFGSPPSVLPLARAGRLKVVAVTSPERSPLFPDLPTIAESGVVGYAYSFWFGLFGPAGLPQPIVDRLFAAATGALADGSVREILENSGNEVAPSASPREFAEWARTEGARERELTAASVVGG